MQIINLVQGSAEWLAHRTKNRNASEAPSVMGASKNTKRDELLLLKKTGDEKGISDYTREVVFPRGHEVERLARPIAEKIVGEELFPVSGVADDGYLAASFDGLNMLHTIAWECKQWNEAKAEQVRNGTVPEEDRWQVVQQLAVSGAEKCLYMVTDGTEEKTVATWYEASSVNYQTSAPGLMAGWAQFDRDLETFVPQVQHVAPEANPVQDLPAIVYKLDGLAITSNLKDYQAAASMLVAASEKTLSTDQEFADAEARIKAFKKAEDNITLVIDQVINEFTDINKFRTDLQAIGGLLRQARINSDKQIKARKIEIRNEIAATAQGFLDEHIAEINSQFNREYITAYAVDWFEPMKGLKNINSLRSAVNDKLAESKIALNDMASRVHINTKTLNDLATDFKFLFVDIKDLIFKDADDFRNLVESRINAHKATLAAQEEAKKSQEETPAVVGEPRDTAPAVDTPQNNGPASAPATIQEKAAELGSEEFRKIILESLKENGLGDKTARKVARLIVDGKVRGVTPMLNEAAE